MIELVLVVFLVGVAAVTTVAVKVGLKIVDFIEETRRFQRGVESRQDEIIRLLKAKSAGQN
ncbi:MAG: hypothetical protein NTV79_08580 [Candidatus Aureabacteria bacterium]|nr:hypothetical protein [Candidatus Auribacterota bacterium]